MIIYGSRSKELAREVLLDKCTHCGTSNSIDMHVFQKYAHVFWIPFFPLGKTGVSQCDHCKQVLRLKEMPSSLKESYNIIKAQTKTPLWMFAGLAIVGFFITAGVISEIKKDEKNAQLVLAPKSGDILEVKLNVNSYTIYKIEEVTSDSVFIRLNNYETNKRNRIDDLKKKGEDSYSEDVYGYSKAGLKAMLEKGEIIDIDRK
jgi:hypothetical protein